MKIATAKNDLIASSSSSSDEALELTILEPVPPLREQSGVADVAGQTSKRDNPFEKSKSAPLAFASYWA